MQLFKEIARYLSVGILTSVIYFGVIFLLVEFLEITGYVPVSIAYAVAVSFHFVANKTYTFNASSEPVRTEILRYALLLAVNYSITLGTVYWLVDCLGYPTYLGAGMAIVATLGSGYLMSKFWVFPNGDESE